jgi:hypothetical protein
MSLQSGIEFMVSLGLLDVVLPFVLVFTVVYGLLQRTLVLGTENGKPRRPLNAMVAVILSFIGVASLQQVELLQLISSISAVGIVIMVVLMMLLGLLGTNFEKSKLMIFAGLIIIVAGVLIVLGKLGFLPPTLADLATAEWGAPFMVLVVFFVIGWFIVRESPQDKPVKQKEDRKNEERPKAEKPSNKQKVPSREELAAAARTFEDAGIQLVPQQPPMAPPRTE